MTPGTRPAWGCLDLEEMRAAATGHGGDPNIQAHLSRCEDCRRAVHDLSRELGHRSRGSRIHGAPHRRSLAARPGFWLALILLALAGYGIKVFLSRKTTAELPSPPPAERVAAPAEQPAAPLRRRRPVRSRPVQAHAQAQASTVDILGTIRRNQGGVKACYERALKRDPNLASRLDVEVRVRATGAVEHVSIDGPIDATELGACIRNNIKTWAFPQAPEAYGSQFPLILVQKQ